MSKKKGQAKVTIYQDWCKGCGICVAFCPAGVFALGKDGKAYVANETECVNCGFCELHCPDFAVSVTPKDGGKKPETSPEPRGDARAERPVAPCNPDPGPEEAIPAPATPEVEHGNQKV